MTKVDQILIPYRRALYILIGVVSLTLATPSISSAQVFRYPESSKQSSLMPFFVENMSAVRITEFIFEPLVTKNKRGDIQGVLAQSWSASPDGMSITFKLRQGVKWHDGKTFTARDVAFTVKAAQDKKNYLQ